MVMVTYLVLANEMACLELQNLNECNHHIMAFFLRVASFENIKCIKQIQ